MLLSEAITLIQHPITNQINTWADLGCGNGLFTNALSQLLNDESIIYAIDKNKRSLKNVEVRDTIILKKLALDFVNDDLPVENLSGILMANSFHFVKDKNAFIKKVFNCLSTNGYLIIVEYNTDKSNLWVPNPISFRSLQNFFKQFNFTTEKLYEMPSRYHGVIYSAIIKSKLG